MTEAAGGVIALGCTHAALGLDLLSSTAGARYQGCDGSKQDDGADETSLMMCLAHWLNILLTAK